MDLEDPVLGLGGSGSDGDGSSEFSEEEEGESDGVSGSEEEEEEEGRGGRRGRGEARAVKDGDVVGSRARRREAGSLLEKMERQNKLMEMKLRAEAGEDDSGDEGEEEPAGGDERGWGRNRKAYYQKGEELDGEDEALEREEAEALRLQRQGAERLAASDFDLELDEGSEEEEEEEGEEEEKGRGGAGVPADLVALSAEERDALAAQDAPELAALLGELQESMSEVRNVVQPLLKQVREGGLVTERGLSFLEAKHLLLLAYCGHIVHYLLVKAEGGTIQGHPVVAQLVQLRAYLEKVKPIDKKLQHQVERLLRASGAGPDSGADAGEGGAAGGKGGRGDALRHRPNPGALVAKAGAAPGGSDSEGSEGEEDGRAPGAGRGVYRPPKIAPVAFEGPDGGERGEGGLSKEARRRALRGEYLREMAQELRGAPEEESLLPVGMRAGLAQRERERWRKRAAQEEDIFRRVDLSKAEKQRARAAERAGLSGAALLDDLGEDLADLVGREERGGVGELYRSGAVQGASRKRGGGTGDDDGPAREGLGTRRARFDSQRASRAAAEAGSEGRRGGRRAEPQRGEEDDFYRGAREASQAKKKARKSKYAAPESHPPVAEAEAAGKRNISYEIEKNRGLTPHRSKALKNPRKKHRIKYGQAVVRRKGQVQEVRAQKETYGGEATGVRGKLTRSRKL